MLFVFTGLFAAALTIFLNYCFGKPSSEFSPYEIFSSYTIFLSKRRLIKVGLWDKYLDQYRENYSHLKTKHEIINFKNDFKKVVYEAAEPFFTWERAVGMCPVCTGFWISLFTGIIGMFIFSINSEIPQIFVDLGIIILTSHLVIRILNKIL